MYICEVDKKKSKIKTASTLLQDILFLPPVSFSRLAAGNFLVYFPASKLGEGQKVDPPTTIIYIKLILQATIQNLWVSCIRQQPL